ncbi:MAG TPA: type I-U CRISPR-associated helicase/endonuclease Cas3 [Polyangiaceae bacterium]|nr:type I-U CRISPR-associated helicase/endonuclease Cas3 [Polyangiaceae bacterium]
MTPSSFTAFFQALWGREPFDWQTRLLQRVVERGWPSILDLPTGAGKTAALDVAVFALALDAARPPGERKQSRRIVLVVDRRVVVDQAFERATIIAEKLDKAEEGILAEIGRALREVSGNPDGLPILPAILRGGMPRESEWAKSPSQPVILTSTVDQVGSRLLFRGYGVSAAMRSVHAGLLGCDTLLLLDEVHLARPFEETLTAITRFYANTRSARVTRPLQFVRMSATVTSPADDTFGLSERDRQNPLLSARLEGRKIATLRQVNTPRDPGKAADALAKAAVREVERLCKGERRALAVIVNRVETAKKIALLAQEAIGTDWTVSLLTGRMRPLDRLDKQAAVLDHVMAGRKRSDESPRLLLVSTQAIEAGADFDFDALITECASLDALRQRFGRLDRLGDLGATEAVILAGSSSVDEKADPDPIYGDALRKTWRFLSRAATPSSERDGPTVDLGIDAMSHLLEELGAEQKLALVAPRAVAPILTSSHLDRWVQTSPAPHADPEVGPFLHGIGRGAAEVQIVWRADIGPADLKSDELPKLRAILDLVRPSALEALSVPLWAAKQWLGRVYERNQGKEANPDSMTAIVADVEGATAQETEEGRIANALAWHGGNVSLIERPDDLRPGLTLIVPSAYGGLDQRFACWDSESTASVVDRGDEAQLLQKGRAVVRWQPAVIQDWAAPLGLSSDVRSGPKLTSDEVEERGAAAEREAFIEWHALTISEGNLPAWVKVALTHLAKGSTTERVELTRASEERDGRWRAQVKKASVPRPVLRELLGMPELRHAPIVAGATEPATEGDEGSFLGSRISLNNHLSGVRDFAQRFGEALGLHRELTSDLALCGWTHDLGKADPRFQLLLHGGDAVQEAAAPEPLLAKSAVIATDRQARSRAQERSGYPKGMRHELLSVALVEREAAVRERAHDWDLVLHLVASHHGWCRPFAPPVLDPDPQVVSVDFEGTRLTSSSAHDLQRFDSALSERFWKLIRHYGYWGLAWLEAVLRLADHRESEQEAAEELNDK